MAAKNVLALLICTLPAVWIASLPVQAADTRPEPIRVKYINPEQFSDAGDGWRGSGRIRSDYLDQLRQYLVRRAASLLADGQQLTIDITDVDLAGDFEPWRPHLHNVRIVKEAWPPRIDLRFRLTGADGTVLREGERKLRNPAFMMTGAGMRDDPLRYEQALLDGWLDREFRRPGRR